MLRCLLRAGFGGGLGRDVSVGSSTEGSAVGVSVGTSTEGSAVGVFARD